MREGGVRTYRLAISWPSVQLSRGAPLDWTASDRLVRGLVENGIEPLPVVYGTPCFVVRCDAGDRGQPSPQPPLGSGPAKLAWAAFLNEVAGRYGPGGSFWRENPSVPRRPREGVGDLERAERASVLRSETLGGWVRRAAADLGAGDHDGRSRRDDPGRGSGGRPRTSLARPRDQSSSTACTGAGHAPTSTPSRSTRTPQISPGCGVNSSRFGKCSRRIRIAGRRSGSPSLAGGRLRAARGGSSRRSWGRPRCSMRRSGSWPRSARSGTSSARFGTRGAIRHPVSRRAHGVAPPGSSTRPAIRGRRGLRSLR